MQESLCSLLGGECNTSIECDLVKRYWVDSATAFERRITEIVEVNENRIELFELCKNNVGQKVPGIRMGKGLRNIFLLGREHCHEPAGTCGLTAIAEGLAKAEVPGLNNGFPAARDILENFTLYMLPIMNPDGAERFSRQVKDSFLADQFSFNREDSEKYRMIHSEPLITLKKGYRAPHFTDEEMDAWRRTGRPVGSLFTEDGVELWIDWEHDRAPQTRALKRLMQKAKPYLFVDVHQWEGLTEILAPAELDEKKMDLHKYLGSLLYDSLEAASIPFHPRRQVRTTRKTEWVGLTSIHWVNENFHAMQFLYEVDNGYRWYREGSGEIKLPTISKAQVIMSVWYGLTAMLKAAMHLDKPSRKP